VDIVKGLVINAERFIRILHELVNGKSGVIRLNIVVEKMPPTEK
jgi:hypothetical protein